MFGTNAYRGTDAVGTGAKIEKPTVVGGGGKVSFVSPKQIAVVGQSGDITFGVVLTDALDGTSWRGVIFDGSIGFTSITT